MLVLFARASQVHWVGGLVLGVGSMVGAFVSSHLAVKEGATNWIRWVLVVAALGAATRMILVS